MNFHVAIQEVWCRIVAEFLASCKAAFQSTVNRTGVGIGAKAFYQSDRDNFWNQTNPVNPPGLQNNHITMDRYGVPRKYKA